MRPAPVLIAIPFCAALVLCSCGGTVLRTIGPQSVTLTSGLRLRVSLPCGDIEVVSDLPAASDTATAELAVLDAGLLGLTLFPASADDADLRFSVSGGALGATAVVDTEAETSNLTFSLTLHLPLDYEWRSASAQDPNSVETGWGKIHVHGLKGDPSARYFQFWASNPLASDLKPEMVIEDVVGRITASCWGKLTMRGCTEIMLTMSDLETDIEILGPGGSISNLIHSGGPLTMRVKTGTNLSFYNEFITINAFEDALWTVVNEGEPEISGPVDATYEFNSYKKVQTGSGGEGYSAFLVTSSGGSITYKKLE